MFGSESCREDRHGGLHEGEVLVGEVSAEVVDHAVEGVDEIAGRGDGVVHGGVACDSFEEIVLVDRGEVAFGDFFRVEE